MSKNRRERRAAVAAAAALPSNVTRIDRARAEPPDMEERGISGTLNDGGRIHAEHNAKLLHELAFGDPTSGTYGEWEKLTRTDHAVSAARELIAAPLRDATLEVEPGGEDERSILIADFVRDNFTEWLEPRPPTLIDQVVKTGLGMGFSLHEVVADTRLDKRVPGGRAVYIKKLAQRLASSIQSDGWKEVDGELVAIHQHGMVDGKWEQDIVLPADKVVLATWDRSGNNYAGFSAFRPVWYLGLLRAELLRIIAIGHAREALGIPVIKRKKGAGGSAKDLATLEATVKNIVAHENAYLILPEDYDIEWVFSQGANKSSLIESWKAFGLAILEVVQAQQMFLGTSDTGSRAVGEVHDATKNAFVNGVRAWLEGVLNGVGDQPYTGIVRRLVDWNFGPQERYPKLRLVTKKEAELGGTELATAVKDVRQADAITWLPKDENRLRERLGFELVDEEELAEAQEKAAKRAAERAASIPEGGGDPDPEASEEDDEPAPPPTKPNQRGAKASETATWRSPLGEIITIRTSATGFTQEAWSPRRALRREEEHLALADIDAFHLSARDEYERDGRELIHDMLDGAREAIAAAMADGDPSELSELELDSREFESMVGTFIERCRAYGYRQALRERRRQPAGLVSASARGGHSRAVRSIDLARLFAPGLRLDESAASPEKNRRLVDAQRDLVVRRMLERVKGYIQDEAVNAVRRNEGASAVVRAVEEMVNGSGQLRADAGMVTARSFSMGRELFFAEHAAEIAGVTYSAVLDDATCEPCQRLDGESFEFGSPEHDAAVPPNKDCDGRGNCRCLLVVTWDKE